MSESSNSLINNAQMITKVYFPRLAIPLAAVMVSFVDFLISFTILLELLGWYQLWPTWRLAFLPLLILLAFGAALGGGLWMASLNVKYRDFRYVVPFVVQVGFYLSPVGFNSSLIPDQWRSLYSLNPMVGVIDSFRWAILGAGHLYWPGFLLSLALTLLLLASGLWYFRKTERTFANVI